MGNKTWKKIIFVIVGFVFLGIATMAYADRIMDYIEGLVDKAEGLVKEAQKVEAASKALDAEAKKAEKEAKDLMENRKYRERKLKEADQKVKDAKDDKERELAQKELEDAWKKFLIDCDAWWEAELRAKRKREKYNQAQKKKGELIASANEALEEAEEHLPDPDKTTQPGRRNKNERRIKDISGDARRVPPPVKIPPEPTVETPYHTLGPTPIEKIDLKKIGIKITSTGDTINDIAMVSLTNKTNNFVSIIIPPTMLLSITGKNQNYSVTNPHAVFLGPKETKQIPLDGTCVDPDVPPVKKGEVNKSKFADITSPVFQKKWKNIVNETRAIEKTCEDLQEEGKYKTPFSSDPKKERDTIVQWTTWLVNSERKGKPIVKADLTKQILKQVKNPTKEQTEQLKKGADDIWKAIELTKDNKPQVVI